MLAIPNGNGRGFNVRVVLKGDGWGRNDARVYGGDDPLLEFRMVELTVNDPRGYLVSTYCLSVLEEYNPGQGLMLEGSRPEWSVSATDKARACAYARGVIEGRITTNTKKEV